MTKKKKIYVNSENKKEITSKFYQINQVIGINKAKVKTKTNNQYQKKLICNEEKNKNNKFLKKIENYKDNLSKQKAEKLVPNGPHKKLNFKSQEDSIDELTIKISELIEKSKVLIKNNSLNIQKQSMKENFENNSKNKFKVIVGNIDLTLTEDIEDCLLSDLLKDCLICYSLKNTLMLKCKHDVCLDCFKF